MNTGYRTRRLNDTAHVLNLAFLYSATASGQGLGFRGGGGHDRTKRGDGHLGGAVTINASVGKGWHSNVSLDGSPSEPLRHLSPHAGQGPHSGSVWVHGHIAVCRVSPLWAGRTP